MLSSKVLIVDLCKVRIVHPIDLPTCILMVYSEKKRYILSKNDFMKNIVSIVKWMLIYVVIKMRKAGPNLGLLVYIFFI